MAAVPEGTEPDVFEADGTFSEAKARFAYERIRNLPPPQKAAMLKWMKSARVRAEIKSRYANAAEVAKSVDPDYNITPALKLIADAIENVLAYPRTNLLVTTPPQEGKSSLCSVWTPIRALQLDPNRRVILATYGDALATMHSQTCRDVITQHGTGVIDPVTDLPVQDKIGLKLSPTSRRIDAWKIDGGRGGLVAVGLGSSITGRPADLMIIDDPYKNMMEADSASWRARVNEWMSSVAMTRLSPEASIILVQTRWHPEDLSGVILNAESAMEPDDRSWRHINIPAIAEIGITDALGREPGEVMVSARGRTKSEFEATRRAVGERVWYALYQGSPRNPAGGLFLRAWFDPRRDSAPARPIAAVVGIDPADSGEGDETGLIGAMLDSDGTVVLVEDWSAQMTADQWAKKAVEMALTIGAREISMEAFATATTYVAVLNRAWKDMQADAIAKHRSGAPLTQLEQKCLTHQRPFTIHKWRTGGDAVGRAALLRQAFEVKKCRTVEYKLGVFEDQACDWQQGQHQPDRVAAAIIAHDRLHALGSGQISLASPVTDRPIGAPEWMTRKVGSLI